MTRRFAALFIIFSILFVSTVHACSGLGGMRMLNSSENPMIAGEPCDHGKQGSDVCKSVRYRMLSIRAESLHNDPTLLPSTLPHALSVDDPLLLGASLAPLMWTMAFRSFPKQPPLLLSHIVLRI